MVLNNVTMFHKVVIKITGLVDWTTSKTVNFHEQRAITTEVKVRYKPLSHIRDAFCGNNPNSA